MLVISQNLGKKPQNLLRSSVNMNLLFRVLLRPSTIDFNILLHDNQVHHSFQYHRSYLALVRQIDTRENGVR